MRGHNVTMDNFFTSYELGQKLLSKGLTMVGTVRKNKRSIPPKLLQCKKVPLYTSTFAFTEDTAMVSYIGRKDKCALLQSTLHDAPTVGSVPKQLPEIIEYYNKTKGGVDTVDKMISTYTCKRKTNRWPMAVFSNIVDISCVNSYVIYSSLFPNWPTKNKKAKRRQFLKELGETLAKPYMLARSRGPRSASSASLRSSYVSLASPGSTQNLDADIFEGEPSAKRSRSASPIPPQQHKRGRCYICVKNKAATAEIGLVCVRCNKNVCKANHHRVLCIECLTPL